MTTIVANTFRTIGVNRLADWFKNPVAEIQRRRNIRHTIEQLSALSARELDDIGLTRGDIRYVAHTSYPKGKTVTQINRNLQGWV